MAILVLTNTCLVAHHISGIFSDVRTLAEQILLNLPCKVDVVGGADEAHGQSPYVPLEDLLARVVPFLFEMAANSELSGP